MLEPWFVQGAVDGRLRDRTVSVLARAVGWTVVAVICAAYLFYFANLRAFPLQDFPNHIARAVVISDLLFDHGVRYGQTYSLALLPIPYVLHDLILAGLVKLFGVQAGSAIFCAFVLVSLPAALMFYLRATRLAPRAALFVFMVGLYLATDWFFLMAFMGFRLALAILVVSLALAEILRRQWSRAVFCAYAAVLVAGYLTHLTTLVFFTIALGVSTPLRLWFRATSVRRELYLWLPVAALLVAHFGFPAAPQSATNPATYEYFWGSWHAKLQHLPFEFIRFGSSYEQPLLLLFIACLLWPLRRSLQRRRLLQLRVLEPLLIAAAFAGFYFILPESYTDSSFVDVRALTVVAIMALLASLNMPEPQSRGRSFEALPVLGLAFLLAVANFAYLMRHVGKAEASITQYRDLGKAIPEGSYVLPIHTIPKDGTIRPLLHAGAYLVADRNAVIPYLFSGDRGDPMKYFRYRERPYTPDEDWYRARLSWDKATEQTFEAGGRIYSWRFQYSTRDKTWAPEEFVPVDWSRVACRYDFLLMTLPVDVKLIGVPTRPVLANETAALVAVDKSACRSNLSVKRTVRLPTEH